ncbi:sulfite exporter TauE/SafE family protein [Thalassomonas sp. M1454]|uniref:sulfite exporter TauE/SafE family protein n=1 Tax=Thalassomonas sp. M1454 TaxID=2594477 RepID=UPI001181395E|nr:sulfite exporter TauE/SafE family protein [Thalassomonas sp. M1454]TRX56681.1 sulfite exporter TauE/SafE family protein [Thalassomonas sp. M1454]
MLEHIFLFIISLIANTLSSLAGGGAGLLQLPALIFLGLPFGVALVTHKIAAVALGVGASIKHLKNGSFKWQLVTIMTAGALPGVVLGANIILTLPENIAMLCLGVLTIGLGVYSILKPNLGMTDGLKNLNLKGYIIGGLGLFLLGILNGSLTSGTGLFVTIWLIHWFGMNYARAVSYTLVMVGILWNGSGAIALALQESIKWDWLPALILGALIGGYIGAHLAIAKGNILVKRTFEIMTILTGIALLYKAF